MSGARPKDPGRRYIGPPVYRTADNRRMPRPRPMHTNPRFYLDHYGEYHPTRPEEGDRVVARNHREHASRGRGRGRGSLRGRVPSPSNPHNRFGAVRTEGHNNSDRKPRALGAHELKEILEKKSSDSVAHSLADRIERLMILLNDQKIRSDVIELLLSILVRVFESKVSDQRKAVVEIVKDSEFLKKVLVSYITHLGDKTNEQNENQGVIQIQRQIHLLLKFLKGLMSMIEGATDDFAMSTMLLGVKSKALFEERMLSKEALIDVLRFIKEAEKHIAEVKEEEKRSRRQAFALREGICDGPPPDDYRDIPILPTRDDLHMIELPFLRPNITKGSYSSHHHYLDVQFRLLREDFVSPLRDGIQTHLANVANPLPRNQRKRNTDVRLYYDVKIDHPVFSHQKGVLYRVKFSLCNLTRVKWQNTKRLIFGSLVCLSHDNFQTLLFGTVGDRDENLLRRGLVDIKIHNMENMDYTRVYTMVESTAFYESYRPVLQVLQQFDEDTIPMENYIIHTSHNIQQPKYIRNQPGLMMYDISALMDNNVRPPGIRYTGLERFPRKPSHRYTGLDRYPHNIDILNDDAWPEIDKLTLDASQLNAVKSALTKELAVIQGPPGTGKTYIGLKIVETLLLNKERWSSTNDEVPENVGSNTIMVICYTNHALDQFLEGIHTFCPRDLVRIGGRSKSEKLAPFNLRELARKYKDRRREDFNVIIDPISDKMLTAEEMMKLCDKHIVSEHALGDVIKRQHFRCLTDSREEYGVDGKRSSLPTWLGLLSRSNLYEPPDDVAINDDDDDDDNVDESQDEEHGQDHDTKNIVTEFDMLLRRREYDDISGKKDYENKRKSIVASLYSNLAYNPERKCKDTPLKIHQASMLKQLTVINDEMTEQEATGLVNIRRLSPNDRWRLYRYWIAKYKGKLRQVLFDQQQVYDRLVGRSIHQNHEAKCRVLRNADVIGMTTTGAAMNKELLNDVRPRIVVVEEAAEILEAHIVTSLTQQCEHLILIGDHQQLKPNPTVYKLATKFNLDTSLFERMLTNGVPCQKLSSQHRMRPEISNIMRRHFYSHLLDDESVKYYDDVKGVSPNLFFINHDIQEESVEDILSKSNAHEAEYCVALAKYLFQQGYEASDITILTTYTGQVLNLKGILRKEKYACLRDIYVSAVDSYQGEENEIILLSLVRSNEAGNIGFLKVSNRMCVALSRAKKGLFCIGNFKLLAEKNDLWMKIVQDMRTSGLVGNHLELYCQNHVQTRVKANAAKDFEKCPMGGCKLECETRLDCGHACPMLCHPRDPHHKNYECRERCVRTCTRGHPCRLLCFKKCHPCTVSVSKTLDCLHDVQIQCNQFEGPIECTNPCDRPLVCGHGCKQRCFERCTTRCLEILTKSFVPCGHTIEVECYISTCQVPCSTILACGHVCKEKCGDTCTVKCTEIIKKTFECGHTVSVPCFTPTCTLPCPRERTCGHPCPKLCGESCGYCFVKVNKDLECGHHKVLACYEDAADTICKQMCSKKLQCGHPCQLKCYRRCSASPCTVLVKKELICKHEKELPCNVDPKDNTDIYHSLRFLKHTDMLRCEEKVIVTRKCKHETTVECWKSSTVESTRCIEMVVDERLDCGHTVTRKCSEKGVCKEKCSRLLQCGHKCKERCANPCTAQCNEKVEKKLKCEHLKRVSCCVDVAEIATKGEAVCHFKKTVPLPCGHNQIQLCYQSNQPIVCGNRCSNKLPCGHSCTKTCAQECTIDSCKQPCRSSLVCGHSCKGNCMECSHGNVHKACLELCRKKLICGHICQQHCSIVPCQPCKKQCMSRCCHGRCKRACADILCTPCKSQCEWRCPHLKCTNRCDEMCNRDRCNQPCPKTLKCRHRCSGLCGELCICLICDPANNVPAKTKGTNSRYVFLFDCSHVFEVSKMDAYMDEDEGIRRKECPLCHTTISYNPRYGNVLKAIDMRITAIKRIAHAERSMRQVQDRRKTILSRLSVLKTIEIRRLLQEVNSRDGILYYRLIVIGILITLLERVDEIRVDLNQHGDIQDTTSSVVFKQLDIIEKRVWNCDNIVCRQFLADVSSELQRVHVCGQLKKLQINTDLENFKNTTLLSTILHSKIPVPHGIMLEALGRLGQDGLTKVSLVHVADNSVGRCPSFCHEGWSTCHSGHVVMTKDINNGCVENCRECAASAMDTDVCIQEVSKVLPNDKSAKLKEQKLKESVGDSNYIQTPEVLQDNGEVKVNPHKKQNRNTGNQRRKQPQRNSKEVKVNANVKQTTAATPNKPCNQGVNSPVTKKISSTDTGNTRAKQKHVSEINSSAHSNACSTAGKKGDSSKSGKTQVRNVMRDSKHAAANPHRGNKSKSKTREQPQMKPKSKEDNLTSKTARSNLSKPKRQDLDNPDSKHTGPGTGARPKQQNSKETGSSAQPNACSAADKKGGNSKSGKTQDPETRDGKHAASDTRPGDKSRSQTSDKRKRDRSRKGRSRGRGRGSPNQDDRY